MIKSCGLLILGMTGNNNFASTGFTFAVSLRPSVWEYMRVNLNALVVEELSVPEYLQFKEELVDGP